MATAGFDGTCRIWDIKTQRNVIAIPAHNNEVLYCDFNKYSDVIATCSTDHTIKVWDLRRASQPIMVLFGHRYPVKKVKFSPFSPDVLLSCSYDMSVKLWNTTDPVEPLKKSFDRHHEFVQDIDWSQHQESYVASISWDQKLYTWNVFGDQPFLA